MNRSLPLLFLAFVLLVSPRSRAAAEVKSSVFYNASASVYSDYLFRGLHRHNGASLQLSALAAYDTPRHGIVAGYIWGHLSEETTGERQALTELDYTLFYEYSRKRFSVMAGHTFYTFPEDSDGIQNTAELFLSATADIMLSPRLSLYHDYDELESYYYELGFSHPIDWPGVFEGFNVTPFVTFGYARSAERVYSNSGLVTALYGMYSEYKFSEVLVAPKIAYTAKHDANTVNHWWGGVTVSYEF